MDPLHQWGQWRGPLGTGEAPHGDPPLTWSEESNVRWKTEIPGQGHSTPVVWGDRIFLTTAVAHGEIVASEHDGHDHADGDHDNVPAARRHRFVVLALDRRDGSILWQREVHDGAPHESAHQSGGWASASAVTDGSVVVASFGSVGVYGLDLDGKLLWRADLGKMRVKHGHGEGSSPALHGDTVVVNWDHQGESFVVALDKRTGKERWRAARDELTSWSSPLIVEHEGRSQAIVAATKRVRGYDLSDGKPLWQCGGLSGNVVATPVAANGIVYVANSYETRSMIAIRLAEAHGEITGSAAVVWRRDRDTPYVPSPVLTGGTLCFLKHYQGILTCVDAASGDLRFGPSRLSGIGNVYASLVAADGRLYVVDLDGTTVVLEAGDRLKVLARNQLEESIAASPAIVGRELLLRGERHLYCIADDDDAPAQASGRKSP